MGWLSSIQKLVELTTAVERLKSEVSELVTLVRDQERRLIQVEAREGELIAKAEKVAAEKSAEAVQRLQDQLTRLSFELGKGAGIQKVISRPEKITSASNYQILPDE